MGCWMLAHDKIDSADLPSRIFTTKTGSSIPELVNGFVPFVSLW